MAKPVDGYRCDSENGPPRTICRGCSFPARHRLMLRRPSEALSVICPYCGTDNDKVIDSRASDGGLVIRRRRECIGCEKRFTTYERVEKTSRLAVVKKDGRREPFDQHKVLSGVEAACGKRPISEEAKIALVQAVEDDVHREFDREAPSSEIGRRVAEKLRNLDHVAYIRYASEYYEFRTIDDFHKELAELAARRPDVPNQTKLFDDRRG